MSVPVVDGFKCADLVDAMGRLHRHRCHILDLVSPTPGRVLFGLAVTISYFPTCSAALDPERYNLANLFYEAAGDDPRGKVLVLASNGYTDVSMGGGTKLSRLQHHGLAGVLTDGRLRDFDELAGYDFAAYCAGEATRWGGGEVTPFQVNVPVVLRGAGVIPGAYVFADSSGAVVIPPGDLEQVLAEARSIEADDARSRAEIARENGPPPWSSTRRDHRMSDNTETAILAGGCFWGVQELLRQRDGVTSTRVGYTGGENDNPTYANHPGHAEAVEIVFDPERISYRDILEFFFQIHDPTTVDRQGNDVGSAYRSEIFATSDEQREVAEETIADVDASGLWPGKVVTEISEAVPFWEAEPEHQDYLQHYPNGYTCHYPRPGWKLPHRETAV